MLMQPYKALGLLSFIEKTQFSKSSSPDKEESSRDSKDSSADIDSWRASISQVCTLLCVLSGAQCMALGAVEKAWPISWPDLVKDV